MFLDKEFFESIAELQKMSLELSKLGISNSQTQKALESIRALSSLSAPVENNKHRPRQNVALSKVNPKIERLQGLSDSINIVSDSLIRIIEEIITVSERIGKLRS